MFAAFRPTWHLKAIYNLTPTDLRQHGIKAVLTDLDNTLIAWNNPDGTKQLRDWLQTMSQAGIPVMVVSNNSHKRVSHALRQLDLDFVSRALKPLTRGLKQAMQQLGLKPQEVVLVGDQLLTDIWSGHNAAVRTILVDPIIETDAWNTQFNRLIERRILKKLNLAQAQETLNGK